MLRSKWWVSGGILDEASADETSGSQRLREARLVEIDVTHGTTATRLSYCTPEHLRPKDQASITYLAMHQEADRLYLCTRTEGFIHSCSDLKQIASFSHPLMHDVHHLRPFGDHIAVTSTGLDAVLLFDAQTLELKEKHPVISDSNLEKLGADQDYRTIYSTKPHTSHPNYLFVLDDQLWVTRFEQGDAVALHTEGQITVADAKIHDGLPADDGRLYFTTVTGQIIAIDPRSRTSEIYDLNVIEQSVYPLGWCRGLWVEQGIAAVGFSRFRKTRYDENLKGFAEITHNDDGSPFLSTRIVWYDLNKRCKIASHFFNAEELGAVFGILPACS